LGENPTLLGGNTETGTNKCNDFGKCFMFSKKTLFERTYPEHDEDHNHSIPVIFHYETDWRA
jgi:hypothetical protein